MADDFGFIPEEQDFGFVPDPGVPSGAPYRTAQATQFGLVSDGRGGFMDDPQDRIDAAKGIPGYDPRKGAYGHDIKNPNLLGVALTPFEMRQNGLDPRNPQALVEVSANGQTMQVPIVDKLGVRGKVDLTGGLYKALGGPDNPRGSIDGLQYRIVPGLPAAGTPPAIASQPAPPTDFGFIPDAEATATASQPASAPPPLAVNTPDNIPQDAPPKSATPPLVIQNGGTLLGQPGVQRAQDAQQLGELSDEHYGAQSPVAKSLGFAEYPDLNIDPNHRTGEKDWFEKYVQPVGETLETANSMLGRRQGAIGGGLGGAALGAAMFTNPWLSIPAMVGLGYAGGRTGGAIQEAANKALESPEETQARHDFAAYEESSNPGLGKIIDYGSALPFFRPSPTQLLNTARGLGYIRAGTGLPAAERAALINTAAAGGIGAGQHAAVSAIEGRVPRMDELAESAAGMALLNKPTGLGRYLGFPSHDPNELQPSTRPRPQFGDEPIIDASREAIPAGEGDVFEGLQTREPTPTAPGLPASEMEPPPAPPAEQEPPRYTAALKMPDGRTFTGASHSIAAAKAEAEGYKLERLAGPTGRREFTVAGKPIQRGFATPSGDFADSLTELARQVESQKANASQPVEVTPTPTDTSSPVPPTEEPPPPVPAVPPSEQVTSIENAQTDIDRMAMALQPAGEPNRRPFEHVEAEARAKAGETDNLVSELESTPRVVSDTESAQLAIKWSEQQAELDRLNQAVIDGDTNAPALRAQQLDKLQKLSDVLRAVGTKAGQSLAARKMFDVSQWDLDRMIRNSRASRGGRELTPEELEDVNAVHARIKKGEELLSKRQESVRQKQSDTMEAQAHTEDVAEATQAPKPKATKPALKRVSDALDRQEAEAEARIAKRRSEGGALGTGGLQNLPNAADYVIIGAARIARGAITKAQFGIEMLKKLGEEIRPFLGELYNASRKKVLGMVRDSQTPQDIRQKMASRIEDGANLSDLGDYARKLGKAIIQQHIDRDGKPPDLPTLRNELTAQLSPLKPGITEREASDLYSGYGEITKPSQKPVDVAARELRAQAQKQSQIDDLQRGIQALKSGPQRDKVSDEIRHKEQQVKELLRDAPKATEPETQLRSALDAQEARLKNELKDKAEAYDLGGKYYPFERPDSESTQPSMGPKKPLPEDALNASLKGNVDRVRKSLKEVRQIKELTGDEQAAASIKFMDKEIERMTREMQQDIFRNQKKPERSKRADELEKSKELQALREERKSLAELQDDITGDGDRRRLAQWKAARLRQEAELHRRIAAKDYTRKPKPGPRFTPDEEARDIETRIGKLKQDFTIKQRRAERANAPLSHRILETTAQLARAAALSGLTVAGKLTTIAAQTIAVFRPLEQAVGGVYSKLFPKLAAKAAGEGGFSGAVEWHALKETFKKAWGDISGKRSGKFGEMDIDYIHGGKEPHEDAWYNIFGKIHAALKSPARRNEFERKFLMRLDAAERNGENPLSPEVQDRIGHEAYLDAQEAILMEDNFLARWYRRGMTAFRDKAKGSAYPSFGSKLAETAVRMELPVVRIPTNFVLRTLEHGYGTATGLSRVATAYARGIENLKPEQAEAIMKNLKRGSVGLALLLYGLYHRNSVGGLYVPREKKEPGQPDHGDVQVAGITIPHNFLHHPAIEAMQFGATLAKTVHAKAKEEGQPLAVAQGVTDAMAGLMSESPLTSGIISSHPFTGTFQQKMGRYVQSKIPQIVQQAARYMDREKRPGAVGAVVDVLAPKAKKRIPKTFSDYMKMATPGMRNQVGSKQ